MISRKNIMDCVYNQLAIDYNCSPDDFLKDSLIFTEARKCEGRRPFPWRTPRLEMISFGNGVIINASGDVLPYVRKQLEGKTRDEVFWMPFVCGVNPYFLPDIGKIPSLAMPDGFELEMVEKNKIQNLFESNGLHYDVNSPFPEMLVALAKYKDNFVGMARANVDCKTMCQINVDVLQPYRGKGIASTLVNMLTHEVLNRGYIPYYFTSDSHVLSMHVAVRAGYFPAWVHCYKTRLEGILKNENDSI